MQSYLFAFRSGTEAERGGPVHIVEQRDETEDAAKAVQDGWCWHAENSQPNLMRRTAHNEERRNGSDGEHRCPVQCIKTPAAIRAQWTIESLLLHKPPGSDTKFDVCWTAPNSRDHSEDNPALDIACVSHCVVQHDWYYRAVDKHHDGKEEESPTLPSMMPSKRQLRQELRIIHIVVL